MDFADSELDAAGARHVDGINIEDLTQINTICELFKHCKNVIDFFLQKTVFPRAMKEFPQKLPTSAWDLTADRPQLTTGFSGRHSNFPLSEALIVFCQS